MGTSTSARRQRPTRISPSSTQLTDKFRGSFVNCFPPSTADSAHAKRAQDWLHHPLAFEERFHDTVQVHEKRGVGRPREPREAEKEVSDQRFDINIPRNLYYPNPSKSCTWNVPLQVHRVCAWAWV